MPDPTGQTISATQVPMLFNQSPYGTRWMLWHHFHDGLDIEADENERMDIGRALQPGILALTAAHLRLDVRENADDRYARHPELPLGCTVDAEVMCPERGLGVVEAKNVDFIVFKSDWTDAAAPRHIELQIQAQMMVQGASWGVIAALVGGNSLKLYERRPLLKVQGRIATEAWEFWQSLERHKEPDPFGSSMEVPGLAFLYPEAEPTKIEDATDEDALAEIAAQYAWAKEQEAFHGRVADTCRAQLLARAKDAGRLRVQGGLVKITKSETPAQIVTPDMVGKTIRRASIKQTVKVIPIDDGTDALDPFRRASFAA